MKTRSEKWLPVASASSIALVSLTYLLLFKDWNEVAGFDGAAAIILFWVFFFIAINIARSNFQK